LKAIVIKIFVNMFLELISIIFFKNETIEKFMHHHRLLTSRVCASKHHVYPWLFFADGRAQVPLWKILKYVRKGWNVIEQYIKCFINVCFYLLFM
jgi:hypothetical protein